VYFYMKGTQNSSIIQQSKLKSIARKREDKFIECFDTVSQISLSRKKVIASRSFWFNIIGLYSWKDDDTVLQTDGRRFRG
jgi:hypothetical protein